MRVFSFLASGNAGGNGHFIDHPNIFWDFMAQSGNSIDALYLVPCCDFNHYKVYIFEKIADFERLKLGISDSISHHFPNFLLITMNSQRINNSHQARRHKGHNKNPTEAKQGFMQAPLTWTKRSGARASRHPPRWRAQSDIP